jgi:hemoglobin
MHKTIAALAALLILPLCALAQGDDALYKGGFQYKDAGASPPHDDGLYRDLGGQENIAAFTREFVGLIAQDERIGHFFKRVDLDHLRERLTEQFIALSGGPVPYGGHDMTQIHDGLGITKSDFNRLAEDLQSAMAHHDVPFATQNRLLALLAPMERAIVTK